MAERRAEPGWPAGSPRFRPLLRVVWVVFLLQSGQTAWAAVGNPFRFVSLAGVVVQAVLFSSIALVGGPARRATALRGWEWPLIAAQVVCVVAACLAARQDGLVGLVFVAVSAVILLRRNGRTVMAVVLATVAITVVLPRLLPGWQTIDDLIPSIVLASAAVSSFSSLIKANRELLAAQDEVAALAVDRERERIARDMHDVLGHSLTVVAMKSELAARLVGADPARARAEMLEVQELSRSALADVRATVSTTRAPSLAAELAGARHALDVAGIAAEVSNVADEVPERLRSLFAWAVREGTTNVLRHAAAHRVRIVVSADRLLVEDDGTGPADGAGPASGHGLAGLMERAAGVGASVDVGTAPTGGFRLEVRG